MSFSAGPSALSAAFTFPVFRAPGRRRQDRLGCDAAREPGPGSRARRRARLTSRLTSHLTSRLTSRLTVWLSRGESAREAPRYVSPPDVIRAPSPSDLSPALFLPRPTHDAVQLLPRWFPQTSMMVKSSHHHTPSFGLVSRSHTLLRPCSFAMKVICRAILLARRHLRVRNSGAAHMQVARHSLSRALTPRPISDQHPPLASPARPWKVTPKTESFQFEIWRGIIKTSLFSSFRPILADFTSDIHE